MKEDTQHGIEADGKRQNLQASIAIPTMEVLPFITTH